MISSATSAAMSQSQLLAKLAKHQLGGNEQRACLEMQPRSSRLLGLGMWWLTHHRERAMWWYNRVLMPLDYGSRRSCCSPPGIIATEAVDEILLVCRRAVQGESAT